MTKFSPIVLMGNNDEEASVLKEYAEFWKVPFTMLPVTEGTDLVFTSNPANLANKFSSNPMVISPVGTLGAARVARQFGLETSTKETQVRLPASLGAFVSYGTTLHQFAGHNLENALDDGSTTVLYRLQRSNTYILAVDLISDYRKLLYERMDETASWKFSLVTRMPFSYGIIPSSIRNRAFRTKQDLVSVQEEEYGPVECLRSIFLASLIIASPEPVPIIRFWRRGKSYALAISHDVETQAGLEDGASRLIEVEKELGVRSTWNIPSDRYPLSSQLLTSLAKSGEVGAHDTRHDGKLLFTKGEAKVERVRHCKDKLERLSGKEVRGFRAPLLQHSRGLVDSLREAGYEYDSSMPSWEPLSPTSLKPHGVGTVFPFLLSDIVEVPVSMPQDHQLIRASRLRVAEAVDYLVKVSAWIKKIGGACVMLVHPDYEFSEGEGLAEYHRLLESFRSDPSCDIMTLTEMSRWWAKRQRAHIDSSGKIQTGLGDKSTNSDRDLDVALVDGYGSDGFMIHSPNMISMVETNHNSQRKV